MQYEAVKEKIPGLRVERDVSEVLKEEGRMDLKDINAVVWSHWHWDHIVCMNGVDG